MHETNTFSRVKTDMALIRRRDFHLENEIPQAFRGTRSALGATFEAADKYGWTLVHPVSANPNPSGIVTDDAFEQIAGMILEAADTKGPVDGALLHLHGAMVTKAHEDAEGELLARLRQKLGSRTPIIVTLDLHANVTRNMADNANALIAFRTYPHIDMHERAWQAAELLERAMRGEARPVTVIARRPMLHGLDWGRTQRGPMAELIARGEALEADGKALAVSICAGFALANIQDVGPTVTVTVDQLQTDGPDGQEIAEEFMDHAWAARDYSTVHMVSVAEAVARARDGKPGDKPLVAADFTDNPGGGGYGDATAFLKGLVEAGVDRVAFHAICDPQAGSGRHPRRRRDDGDANPRRKNRSFARRRPADPDRRSRLLDQRQIHCLRADGRRGRTESRPVYGLPGRRNRHRRDHQQRAGDRSRPVHLARH